MVMNVVADSYSYRHSVHVEEERDFKREIFLILKSIVFLRGFPLIYKPVLKYRVCNFFF